ncbi:hypothetical protein GCM10009539_63410 [Cryptosporangium japonicum]|uniref:SCP2 domain-containing protein n=1 Tax=Cryptosporangium japonicum TaxID=80872 RepID=A0ABN0UZI0_9ACTN
MEFRFPGAPAGKRNWWLVIAPPDVDVCDVDPGHDVAVRVTADLRRMVLVWRGDLSWADAVRAGDVVLDGPSQFRRAVPSWFRPTLFASVPRPAG